MRKQTNGKKEVIALENNDGIEIRGSQNIGNNRKILSRIIQLQSTNS